MESYGTSSVWGGERVYDNEFLVSLHGNGWHVDRARFDGMLANCARGAGVEVWPGHRAAASESLGADGWRVALRGDSDANVEARFVVDATGRNACFAVERGARKVADDHLLGVAVRFHFPNGEGPADTRTLVEAQEHGWWYSALTTESRMIVAWMSDPDLIRSQRLDAGDNWFDQLRRSPLTWARVEHGWAESAPRIQTARSQRLTSTFGPGWVAAGDAATTLDPLSSQGILKALRTGKLASFVALDYLAGRPAGQPRYEALVTRDYEQCQATKARFYALERRWPQSPFWLRRQQSAPSADLA